jgi:hypothetical protein
MPDGSFDDSPTRLCKAGRAIIRRVSADMTVLANFPIQQPANWQASGR